ncbi:lamin tail domain-containing protein [Marivirga salinae]|uniref:Lamin tail domain-containing protein n=1 Tax=Marivirga salinarum TaxID=3059078 RepID=A0AA51NBX9_9BACT|nr:lamin tail domain-containing protein [Marivirga sp. BDSF4-3]WMN12159.1 lamin tail domain-containing protein [Marivirga sp. BDSF4-3]
MIKKILILSILLYSSYFNLYAQLLQDDFSDGNFSNNPEWTGDTNDFIVNESSQLQLNFEEESLRPAYLSTLTENGNLDEKEWRFDVSLDFSPSNSNKVEIYLISTTADLRDFEIDGSIQEGYYLEIGENGSDDGISLFYRNGDNKTLIARGGDGDFASAFDVRIRVRRDAEANWEIGIDPNKGENFRTIATGNEASFNETAYSGFICYFTSSRSNSFYFGNIYLGDYVFDTIPPEILEYEILSANEIQLLFSEEITESSATDINSYLLSPGEILPSTIQHNEDTVWLNFQEGFESGVNHRLAVEGISDLEGNILESDSIEFFYFEVEEAEIGDVIITEFFPDPTPVLGLPDEEFVEIYNRSDKFIDLENWEISDNTSSSGTLPSYILYPGEHLILAPSSAEESYADFGEVLIPSSWRALNNGEDSVIIKNPEGIQMDGLGYNLSWYQDEEKSEGGYSIEIINPNLPCFDQNNWRASEAIAGGTPGRENSIVDLEFTGNAPEIISFKATSPTQLEIQFDKKMNLNSLSNAEYIVTPENEITEILVEEAFDNSVKLNLANELVNQINYEITINEVEDCNGNISENLSSGLLYDIVPPHFDSLLFLSDSILLLTFDEPLDTASAENPDNYDLSPQINLQEAQLWSENKVVLIWENDWVAGFPYFLTINGVSDLSKNALVDFQQQTILTSPAKPSFNELIITEIMANPNEDQQLPNRQYVEIYNPTDQLFSLTDVKFMDERDTASLGLNYIEAGEYLLLAPSSAQEDLSPYARVIGLSPWPNLNNRGDDLQLITDESIINQAFYRDSWYKENFKYDEGGWSLEIIDVRNPCLGFSNWRASIADGQGTPGLKNSVIEENIDQNGPELVNAFAPNSTEVIAYFNEVIAITQIRRNQFSISPSIQIESVDMLDLSSVKLKLADELKVKVRYNLSANNLTDCVGNLINSDANQVNFALSEPPEQGDIVLNEVLYDQKSGGTDFIELLNISGKYINLSGWTIEGNSDENVILENENVIIAPGQHLALTSDKASTLKDYPTSHVKGNIIEANLPTLTNAEGIVRVVSANQELEEYFEYSDDLHLPFLRTVDGVSLERIHPEAPINKADSWSSAASAVGYATPGKANSQFTVENTSYGNIEANPKTFAHNQPGRNFTLINYSLEDAGTKATVKIFDMKGTIVNTLANNETLSKTGFFRWDGVDSNGRKVRTGYYIIYFELFTAEGNTRVVKERVAVGF